MNYLFCSVGRRGELLKDFRKSIPEDSIMVAADNSRYAPALYFADKQYIVPRIDAPEYVDTIIKNLQRREYRCSDNIHRPRNRIVVKK